MQTSRGLNFQLLQFLTVDNCIHFDIEGFYYYCSNTPKEQRNETFINCIIRTTYFRFNICLSICHSFFIRHVGNDPFKLNFW